MVVASRILARILAPSLGTNSNRVQLRSRGTITARTLAPSLGTNPTLHQMRKRKRMRKRSQLPQGTMRQRITHRKKQQYTRKKNGEDPLEGGRDARSVSEGRSEGGSVQRPSRSGVAPPTSESDRRERGSGVAADDRTQGSEAQAAKPSGDGRQATGPAWVGWVGY